MQPISKPFSGSLLAGILILLGNSTSCFCGDGSLPPAKKRVIEKAKCNPVVFAQPRLANPVLVDSTLKERYKYAKLAALHLENARRKVEEWGMATISAPMAVMDVNDLAIWKRDEQINYKEMLAQVAESSVQGRVEAYTETALMNQLAVTATPVLPLPGPSTTTATASGTNAATTTTTLPAGLDSGTVQVPAFTSFPAQLLAKDFRPPFWDKEGELNLKMEVTDVLSQTAAAMAWQNMYRLMAVPEPMKLVKLDVNNEPIRKSNGKGFKVDYHQHILFALVQVSCNPGWRTQESYVADVSASVSYYSRRKDEILSYRERRQPTIFSVLPLKDAHTIDMRNSERDVTALAFELAAAFPTQMAQIKGKDLLQFVKRYQRDIATRTPIPVVNSYSTGTTMGFRFAPSLQAMRDPAQRKSPAANVLQATTFPALVTLIVHQNDIDYFKEIKEDSCSLNLLTQVSIRWLLNDRPKGYQIGRWLKFPALARDTEEKRIDLSYDISQAYSYLDAVDQISQNDNGLRGSSSGLRYDPLFDKLRRDVTELEEKTVGRSWPVPLPDLRRSAKLIEENYPEPEIVPVQMKIDKITAPASINEVEPFILRIKGEGLDQVLSAYLDGKKASSVVYMKPELILLFGAGRFNASTAGAKLRLELINKSNAQVESNELTLTVPAVKEPTIGNGVDIIDRTQKAKEVEIKFKGAQLTPHANELLADQETARADGEKTPEVRAAIPVDASPSFDAPLLPFEDALAPKPRNSSGTRSKPRETIARPAARLTTSLSPALPQR